jgi:hypothetical protein
MLSFLEILNWFTNAKNAICEFENMFNIVPYEQTEEIETENAPIDCVTGGVKVLTFGGIKMPS